MQLFLSGILFLSQDTGSEVGKNASGSLTTMTLIPMQKNTSLLFNWEKSYCIFEPFFFILNLLTVTTDTSGHQVTVKDYVTGAL